MEHPPEFWRRVFRACFPRAGLSRNRPDCGVVLRASSSNLSSDTRSAHDASAPAHAMLFTFDTVPMELPQHGSTGALRTPCGSQVSEFRLGSGCLRATFRCASDPRSGNLAAGRKGSASSHVGSRGSRKGRRLFIPTAGESTIAFTTSMGRALTASRKTQPNYPSPNVFDSQPPRRPH